MEQSYLDFILLPKYYSKVYIYHIGLEVLILLPITLILTMTARCLNRYKRRKGVIKS